METTHTLNKENFIKASDLQAPIEVREKNEKSAFNRHGVDSCFLCGKGMSDKAYENAWHIHMTVNHEIVPMDMSDIVSNSNDTQGCFPLGSECAKKVPLTHRFKYGTAGH